MSDFTPDKILDCSGLKCPMPLVKTTKALKEIEGGKILEMISTDPGSELDVSAWSKQTQNELLAVRKDDTGAWHFFIRKKM